MLINSYRKYLLLLFILSSAFIAESQRVQVMDQIKLVHHYYYREMLLPQLTSGPSSVTWSPDGKELIYSMKGSLWIQHVESDTAFQLLDGPGYDYQPDWSPDGSKIVFTRYDGKSLELWSLELSTKKAYPLTQNGAANFEPIWSPDGRKIAFVSTMNTGQFLLYTANFATSDIRDIKCLTPLRESVVSRYYYSPTDHAINPTWHPDGDKIYFVSNREIAHGTGDIVLLDLESNTPPKTIHSEETTWRCKPDISPDKTRLVYSSYLGRNWQQLWLLPSDGGYPLPMTYGDFDNTNPRWSPDGNQIAFISNRSGNTSLWLMDSFTGKQSPLPSNHKVYLKSRTALNLEIQDERGIPIPARVSIIGEDEKFHAPDNAWIHADFGIYPAVQQYESHYFHTAGFASLEVPRELLQVHVSCGPKYEISKINVDTRDSLERPVIIRLKKLDLPAEFENYWSGDLHVHMNYSGHYRNTPENLVNQARAEDLNFIYNLIVNKEQRIPDISYFTTGVDPASTKDVLIFHDQEYHTSFWGHMGFLNLTENYLLPDYVGYPYTAVESLYPHNPEIARAARKQGALAGYVHPFYNSSLYPQQSESLMNDLPVSAALGLVDYYELVAFSDHIPTADVWYKLLNCGLRISAGAGTDAMANYASLRGPVGANRIYVKGSGLINKELIVQNIKAGRGIVTNAPLLGLKVNGREPGDILYMEKNQMEVDVELWMRSAVPVDSVELVWNGKALLQHALDGSGKSFNFTGKVNIEGSGWMLLKAWSREAHPDVPDWHPYASTNPVYLEFDGQKPKSVSAGQYFLVWLDRLEKATLQSQQFRDEDERAAILQDLARAKEFYRDCVQTANIP